MHEETSCCGRAGLVSFDVLCGKERGMERDTIAAIASGLTQSGIGIIRISGDDAVSVADRVFRMNHTFLRDVPTHTVHYGFVYDGEEKLDEAMALVLRAPHSYTAEDTVEIQCHGGPWVMKRILESVVHHGARPAQPGEFSRRAFLNGRMDLSQAEAVMSLISAQNTFAKDASLRQLRGDVSARIRDLREQILTENAYIEAALDDPEHISLDGYPQRLSRVLHSLLSDLGELIRTSDDGRMLAEGIRTVILGRPNAGKSSLLNTLLGEERAIVTQIPGTTRDTLEETIQMNGLTLRLVDTAGIREAHDEIEQIGVDRTKTEAESADLILYLIDSTEPFDERDAQNLADYSGHRLLLLLNKTDQAPVLTKEETEERTGQNVIPISALNGTGMDLLKSAVEELFDQKRIAMNDQVILTNVRHKAALEDARGSLLLVQKSLEEGMPEDFFTIDLMGAYQSLGEILGESVGDDLIDRIFKDFCLGK